METQTRRRTSVTEVVLEAIGLFALGFALMFFFYHASTGQPADEIGAPGHDSFYHVKMAALLPELGFPKQFPWLEFVYFTNEGSDFVSHHTGFHVLLYPFVKASHALTGDYLAGGRWAMCTFFGVNLLLFNLLLRAGRVPYRWLWLVLFLLLPYQFFTRHAFIRAIGPSLVFMQLLLLMIVRRRFVWAGFVVVAYVHLYLGAVLYAPVIVALMAAGHVLAARPEREWPWRLVGLTAAGWAVGVLTYPYFTGMVEFLYLQVAGSGLSPDIEVGREWKPYTDPWWFARMAGVLLIVWVTCTTARLRHGGHLSASELGLLLINFMFLVLTLKARRFIEYWPPICLLSAAYLARPVLGVAAERMDTWLGSRAERTRWRTTGAVVAALLCGGGLLLWAATQPAAAPLLAEWRVWGAVLALLILPFSTSAWVGGARADGDRTALARFVAVPASGALVVLVLWALARIGGAELPPARIHVPAWAWSGLVALHMLVPALWYAFARSGGPIPVRRRLVIAGRALAITLGLTGITFANAERFGQIGRELRCYYDLEEIRRVMTFLQAESTAGDVVFTDDWDVFPLFFYHNTHNRYIVGLDPKFTHERRPDLWERYVRITRGQTPTRSTVRLTAGTGETTFEPIDIGLRDIRDEFGAQYVITDRDHRALAAQLARAPEFAELIYPGVDYAEQRDAPYLVFRVFEQDMLRRLAAPAPDAEGRLYLSQLRPLSVRQGWGRLQWDQTVERRPMSLRGRPYERGLGTHAPSTLVYVVPEHAEVFEAVVGVDDETSGQGSAVARVLLDGAPAFESDLLTGLSAPATVRVDVSDTREITLQTLTTEDGQRFDHVDWANARFTVSEPQRTARVVQDDQEGR